MGRLLGWHRTAGVVFAGVWLAAAQASAQDAPPEASSIALDQFDPTPAGDDFALVPSPYALGETFEPRIKLVFEGAQSPLRIKDDVSEASIVSGQTFMHIALSAGVVDRLLISATLPIALVQHGDDPSLQDVSASSPTGAHVGDLTLGLRVRLYGEFGEPFQIGTGVYIFTPTAGKEGFAGEGAFREFPYLSLGGRFHGGIDWIWTAAAGPYVRNSDNPTSIRYAAGFAGEMLDGHLDLGVEFLASTPVQDNTFEVVPGRKVEADRSTNAELLFDLKTRVWRMVAGFSAGPGLTRAIGTPTFRLAGTIGYEPLPEPVAAPTATDADQDGVDDVDDACPRLHGERSGDPLRNGCPVVDDDEDGIPNHLDACPNAYGPKNADPKANGCPAPSAAR